MNKRNITKKKYRKIVNMYIHFLRRYLKIYKARLGVKCPFVYTDNGKRFYP